MKVSLVVGDGVHQGKVIPIKLAQFVIGRDPQCHLRPQSVSISKRHCVLLVQGDKVAVRDLNSTNGTFINDEPVKGQAELRHDDQLKVGPLLFSVSIERSPAVDKPTPLPPSGRAEDMADDAVADMLLDLQGEGGDASAAGAGSISADSTVLDITLPQKGPGEPVAAAVGGKEDKKAAAVKADANTSLAAKAILEKYLRRPRT